MDHVIMVKLRIFIKTMPPNERQGIFAQPLLFLDVLYPYNYKIHQRYTYYNVLQMRRFHWVKLTKQFEYIGKVFQESFCVVLTNRKNLFNPEQSDSWPRWKHGFLIYEHFMQRFSIILRLIVLSRFSVVIRLNLQFIYPTRNMS